MKKSSSAILLAVLLVGSAVAISGVSQLALAGGVISIPVGTPGASSVTEAEFERIPREVVALHADQIAASGRKFAFSSLDWRNPYIGAGSNLNGDTFSIMLWGGFARLSAMSPDALALVTCHELGHLLGGAPLQTFEGGDWASSEGQCDYFAASSCLWRYLERQDNLLALASLEVDPVLSARCNRRFPDPRRSAICQRIGTAGLNFVRATESVTTAPHRISLRTPDRTQVSRTLLNTYPSPQCRLDTLVAGALNPNRPEGRPRCWFR